MVAVTPVAVHSPHVVDMESPVGVKGDDTVTEILLGSPGTVIA